MRRCELRVGACVCPLSVVEKQFDIGKRFLNRSWFRISEPFTIFNAMSIETTNYASRLLNYSCACLVFIAHLFDS